MGPVPTLTHSGVSVGLITTSDVIRPVALPLLLKGWLRYVLYRFRDVLRRVEWLDLAGVIVINADVIEVEVFGEFTDH